MLRRAALITAISLGAALCAAPLAQARDAIVHSFDGTPIVVHLYAADGLAAGGRAPTVLVGPGYALSGDTRPNLDGSDRIGAATLRANGYNVVTWDPRGFGGSGGTVMFDSADFEGRDVREIVDWLSAQPEAALDGPGDPRVGMSGTSYGGAVQLVAAAIDQRIDAIAPDATWHSLQTSLFKDGAVKAGWLSQICGAGEVLGATDGILSAAGPQLGAPSTSIVRACAEALGGAASPASVQWFADRGPGELLRRITAPTLLLGGTFDALFTPSEAAANYAVLHDAGIPLKMVWYCGGHSPCPTSGGDPERVRRLALAWMDRWLKGDTGVDTGPAFEWAADDGVWRAGPGYPLAPAGTVDAAGAGRLPLTPLAAPPTADIHYASPAADAVEARFAAPPDGSDIVGEPTVTLTYRGGALPARTFLYAQVLDAGAGRVVGGSVTPVPVVLDGRTHTVQRSLEAIAVRGRASSDLRLQVAAGTTVYGTQRSVGSVRLERVEATLPLVDAGHAARSSATRRLGRARQARRPRVVVSSRRVGAVVRVGVRARLRSRPCRGRVTFTLRVGAATHRSSRAVRACRARAVFVLRVPPGRRARASARFAGNAALLPRASRSMPVRLR